MAFRSRTDDDVVFDTGDSGRARRDLEYVVLDARIDRAADDDRPARDLRPKVCDREGGAATDRLLERALRLRILRPRDDADSIAEAANAGDV
jgi:hypothetical protein